MQRMKIINKCTKIHWRLMENNGSKCYQLTFSVALFGGNIPLISNAEKLYIHPFHIRRERNDVWRPWKSILHRRSKIAK